MSKQNDGYGLSAEKSAKEITPPVINYLPKKPKSYNPRIGLIGTGGISDYHLKNYKAFGLNVVAIANRTSSKAVALRDKYYPDAEVYEDYQKILRRDDIKVVDITPHPKVRLPILKAALHSKKHVLSQKPFVLDINEGRKLVNLAKENNIKIAVNQNGRWAPHFSYMREAIRSGIIGKPVSIDFSLQWDQTWIKSSPTFENMRHMVLFDFAIHWFDITASFMHGQKPRDVYASVVKYKEQQYNPPALASCIINYEGSQVRMAFNAHTTLGEEDVTTIVGTKGTLRSRGRGLNDQPVMELYTKDGATKIPLEGSWFENGFKGTMGELLCAIEENREPQNSAENNLESLKLCFAALTSANNKKVIIPGSVNTVN